VQLQSDAENQIVGSAVSRTKQQNSYAAVKRMIDEMMNQIKIAIANEEGHKNWCDAELAKNQAVSDEKLGKLKRLDTKVDTEKESLTRADAKLVSFGT